MNYKLTIAYNGSNFHGWAIQNDVLTIQGYLTNLINEMFNIKVNINASGRTDAYVHATNQVINIKHNQLSLKPKQLMHAINAKCTKDIRVVRCELVDDSFHARFNAVKKTYCYKINVNKYNVFEYQTIYQYNKPINLKLIKKIIPLFVKKQDFLSFSTTTIDQTIREIYSIKVKKQGNYIIFEITGNGFLRNMVRMIVGTLLAYNEQKLDVETIKDMFINPKKGKSVYKVPGCGLYLTKVYY